MVSVLKFRGELAKRGGGFRIFKIQGGGGQKGGVKKFRGGFGPLMKLWMYSASCFLCVRTFILFSETFDYAALGKSVCHNILFFKVLTLIYLF